jgi:hypothetical protein
VRANLWVVLGFSFGFAPILWLLLEVSALASSSTNPDSRALGIPIYLMASGIAAGYLVGAVYLWVRSAAFAHSLGFSLAGSPFGKMLRRRDPRRHGQARPFAPNRFERRMFRNAAVVAFSAFIPIFLAEALVELNPDIRSPAHLLGWILYAVGFALLTMALPLLKPGREIVDAYLASMDPRPGE